MVSGRSLTLRLHSLSPSLSLSHTLFIILIYFGTHQDSVSWPDTGLADHLLLPVHPGLCVAEEAHAAGAAAASAEQRWDGDRVPQERGEPLAAVRAAPADSGVQPQQGDTAVMVSTITAPLCKSLLNILFVCLFFFVFF